jgi:hypothetical protein
MVSSGRKVFARRWSKSFFHCFWHFLLWLICRLTASRDGSAFGQYGQCIWDHWDSIRECSKKICWGVHTLQLTFIPISSVGPYSIPISSGIWSSTDAVSSITPNVFRGSRHLNVSRQLHGPNASRRLHGSNASHQLHGSNASRQLQGLDALRLNLVLLISLFSVQSYKGGWKFCPTTQTHSFQCPEKSWLINRRLLENLKPVISSLELLIFFISYDDFMQLPLHRRRTMVSAKLLQLRHQSWMLVVPQVGLWLRRSMLDVTVVNVRGKPHRKLRCSTSFYP